MADNNNKYTTDELLEIATNLFEVTRATNSYWKLLQQFRENVQIYTDAMNCSPAFYNTIYRSLVESLYVSLSKLYDWDNRSLTVRVILNNMSVITKQSLHSSVIEKYEFGGGKFQRTLSLYEEPFFEKEVAGKKQMLKIFGYSYTNTTVDLTLEETIYLYKKRFKSMQERQIITNLIKQRSKIHAHNDSATNFDFDRVWKEYPLTEANINELIDFAVDFLQFIVEIFSGVHKMVDYVNGDDWEATLKLVCIGQKCVDKRWEGLCNQDDSCCGDWK